MIEPYPLPATSKPPLKIWEKPDPKYNYVMGIDTGEGLGQEYSVAIIFCRQTGAQCAQYMTNQQDPEEFAMTCIALGIHYNNALAVIERNDAGLTVVVIFKQFDELTKKARYKLSRIWKDKALAKSKLPERVNYGWQTNRSNRRHLIFDFKAGIKRGYIKIRSIELLNQMRTFIRKKEGRMEHAEGECDDCIFAAALAWQGFKDIIPREIEKAKKEMGPTTIGEFVDIVKNIHKQKVKDYVIGSDMYDEEISIILRK